MSASSNAGSLQRERILQRQNARIDESIREAAANLDLAYRAKLLQHRELWGQFPVKMRPFWIAQRGRCSICCNKMALDRTGQAMSTWEHVMPRALGGRGHDARNKVLAHMGCNRMKGDRKPTACELLFCIVINEIVFQMGKASL